MVKRGGGLEAAGGAVLLAEGGCGDCEAGSSAGVTSTLPVTIKYTASSSW
jgi:hypothetical protein